MRQMIDPSTIKVDTSNLAKLNTDNRFEITKYNANSISFEIEDPESIQLNVDGDSNSTYGNNGVYYPRIGVKNNDDHDAIYINPQRGDIAFVRSFGAYYNKYTLPFKRADHTTHNLLSDKNVKTLFGDKSIYGTGNIDLYVHDITITKGTGKAFLTVYSSKNTNIDSLDDLKTIAGATFTKSCTGYINSKVIVAITETSFLLADGTTEALTGATFVDTPATI